MSEPQPDWKDLQDQLEEARKFKTFVHKYLDEAGVPADDPTNEHSKAGCRIGARLDLLLKAAAKIAKITEVYIRQMAHWPSCPSGNDFTRAGWAKCNCHMKELRSILAE